MASKWEGIADAIGDYVWKKYIEPRLSLYLSYYRAQVTAAAADGKITVQRPYDTAVSIPYVGSAAGLAVGEECVVLVFGDASNAICLGRGDLANL